MPLERFENDKSSIGWIANLDSTLQLSGVLALFLIAAAVVLAQTQSALAKANDDLAIANAALAKANADLATANAALAKAQRDNEQLELALQIIEAEKWYFAREYELTASWLSGLRAWLYGRCESIRNPFRMPPHRPAASEPREEFATWLYKFVDWLFKANRELGDGIAEGEKQRDKSARDAKESQNREKGLRQELLGLRSSGEKMRNVVFLVDRSGSMNWGPGERAAKEQKNQKNKPVAEVPSSRWDFVHSTVENWLKLLPCEKMALMTFSDTLDKESDLILRDVTDKTIEDLGNRWLDMKPGGYTNTFSAIRAALKVEGVDSIILFTDGEPTKTDLDAPLSGPGGTESLQKQILDFVAKDAQMRKAAGQPPIPINVIGLGDYYDGKFGLFLVKVAETSGGTFIGR